MNLSYIRKHLRQTHTHTNHKCMYYVYDSPIYFISEGSTNSWLNFVRTKIVYNKMVKLCFVKNLLWFAVVMDRAVM